jgi:hypothetical protein
MSQILSIRNLISVLAYIILNTHVDINLFSGFIVINNWRLFMMASAVPSVLTALVLILFPESPKFCIYVRKKLHLLILFRLFQIYFIKI